MFISKCKKYINHISKTEEPSFVKTYTRLSFLSEKYWIKKVWRTRAVSFTEQRIRPEFSRESYVNNSGRAVGKEGALAIFLGFLYLPVVRSQFFFSLCWWSHFLVLCALETHLSHPTLTFSILTTFKFFCRICNVTLCKMHHCHTTLLIKWKFCFLKRFDSLQARVALNCFIFMTLSCNVVPDVLVWTE